MNFSWRILIERIGRFFAVCTNIPEERQPALSASLKKIPDFSWLLGKPNQAERLQGDLVSEYPTVFLDNNAAPRADSINSTAPKTPAAQFLTPPEQGSMPYKSFLQNESRVI